jgi:hypothetical protein
MNIFRIAGKLIEDFKEGATFKAFFQKRILFLVSSKLGLRRALCCAESASARSSLDHFDANPLPTAIRWNAARGEPDTPRPPRVGLQYKPSSVAWFFVFPFAIAAIIVRIYAAEKANWRTPCQRD